MSRRVAHSYARAWGSWSSWTARLSVTAITSTDRRWRNNSGSIGDGPADLKFRFQVDPSFRRAQPREEILTTPMVSPPTRWNAWYCISTLVMFLFLSVAGETNAGNITLRVGDRFQVRGTHFVCSVLRDGEIEVSCVYASPSLTTAQPNSYGVAITNQFAEIVHYRSATSPRIVVRRDEPRVHGRSFPAPARRPMTFTFGPGDSAPISGTHLMCGVAREGTSAGLACLPVGPYASSVPRAWGVFLVGNRAALNHYRGRSNVVDTVIVKTQP
jgi:hypothetical protein